MNGITDMHITPAKQKCARRLFHSHYARHTKMCVSVIPFIPCLIVNMFFLFVCLSDCKYLLFPCISGTCTLARDFLSAQLSIEGKPCCAINPMIFPEKDRNYFSWTLPTTKINPHAFFKTKTRKFGNAKNIPYAKVVGAKYASALEATQHHCPTRPPKIWVCKTRVFVLLNRFIWSATLVWYYYFVLNGTKLMHCNTDVENTQ